MFCCFVDCVTQQRLLDYKPYRWTDDRLSDSDATTCSVFDS